ncbi:hypothetical protein DMN91_001623 [Ooceraea biroi]|uniref:DDE Tnp4 domain-containing protein n=1 Tax=Ooceraea biroi TaxID=2015173 RepID=A0A3L8DYF7_OOCBI|nr:hypothetical protein DMN91_001623 [Ooceraea biroi]
MVGSLSDTSILSASAFGQALERNELDLPTPKSLPNSTVVAHHYFVGDEIFPLRLNLLRPYARKNLLGIAQKVFNYRFSRARRVIENAFGILTTRNAERVTGSMNDNRILRSGFSYNPAEVPARNMSVVHSPNKNKPGEQPGEETKSAEQLESSLIELDNGSHLGEAAKKDQQGRHFGESSQQQNYFAPVMENRQEDATTSRTTAQVLLELPYHHFPPEVPHTDSLQQEIK